MPAATKQKNSSTYDVHPSLAMYQSSLAALKQKTGRSLAEWVKFVNKEGPAMEKERRAWLKEKHGMGMNYAGWIAEQSLGKGDDGSPETYLKNAEAYVEKMYSGGKEPLRPIFDELLVLGRSMGADVKVCPSRP
jgi:hypothetical protein